MVKNVLMACMLTLVMVGTAICADEELIDETIVVGETTEVMPPPEQVVIEVVGFVYNDEQASVTYSDGGTRVYTAAEMGDRNFYIFCRNLSRPIGSSPIVSPRKIIVGRVKVKMAEANTPVDVDFVVNGVTPGAELGTMTIEAEEAVIQVE